MLANGSGQQENFVIVKLRNINEEANFAVKAPKSHIISNDLSNILKRERERGREREKERGLE